MLTTDPKDPCLVEGAKDKGQNECYLVLSDEEKAKGFVRPVRRTYVHVGQKIERDGEGRLLGRLIQIGDPEYDDNKGYYTKEKGFGGYIVYPESKRPLLGRYITQKEVDAIVARKTHFGGCGVATTMGQSIAETYARNPKFYGATFCVGCNTHLPVSEFVWDGTEETVGS